jgi:dTDP-4-dehydrorhamnose 3,5-epimerase
MSKQEWLLPGAARDKQTISAEWNPTGMQLIDGVRIREVRHVPKQTGYLTEIYRRDWCVDDAPVGQVFQVSLDPERISAWHAHERTLDRLFVVEGLARIVVFDARAGSPTYGLVNELKFGEHRPALLVVPPRVWHGVQNIGARPMRMLNVVDEAYDYESPDHWRLPHDSPHVPFSFSRR